MQTETAGAQLGSYFISDVLFPRENLGMSLTLTLLLESSQPGRAKPKLQPLLKNNKALEWEMCWEFILV